MHACTRSRPLYNMNIDQWVRRSRGRRGVFHKEAVFALHGGLPPPPGRLVVGALPPPPGGPARHADPVRARGGGGSRIEALTSLFVACWGSQLADLFAPIFWVDRGLSFPRGGEELLDLIRGAVLAAPGWNGSGHFCVGFAAVRILPQTQR